MWKPSKIANRLAVAMGVMALVLTGGCWALRIPAGIPPVDAIVRINDQPQVMTMDEAINYMATSLGAYYCQNLDQTLVVHVNSDRASRAVIERFWREFQVFYELRYSANENELYQLSSRITKAPEDAHRTWQLVLRKEQTVLWSETVKF